MNINPFLMQFFLLVLPLIMRESMIEWIFCFTILRSTFVCVCVVTKKCNIITVYVCVCSFYLIDKVQHDDTLSGGVVVCCFCFRKCEVRGEQKKIKTMKNVFN